MPKVNSKRYIIQKVVSASSLKDAMKKEPKAQITRITEAVRSSDQLTTAIGYLEEEYEEDDE